MKLPRILLLSTFLLLSGGALLAQKTSVYHEAQLHFKRGQDYYDKAVYAMAREEFDKSRQRLVTPADQQTQVLRIQSDLMYALSSLRMELPEGERQVVDFSREFSGTPMANRALMELGNYYYTDRKYDEAAEFYAMIEGAGLSVEETSEVRFRQGYGHFVKKRFGNAKTAFAGIRNVKNKYYYPANYYYGMSSYYMNNFRDAIEGFKVASGARKYRVQTPFYVVSIHFSQKEYDEVISYGEQVLQESDIQKKVEIGQMVGQAYYEKGMYREALPYLNDYADKNRNLSPSDYFQVAYSNYDARQYGKSIEYFRQASSDEGEIGQMAYYYLGDAYVRNGERSLARASYLKASNMKKRADIAEDALFQYAKLSAELNSDQDAITALLKFNTNSRYYAEAQDIIGDILLNTRDFENAIRIIEGLPELNAKLKEAYQKVTYFRATQVYNNKQYDQALALLDKSLRYPVDAKFKTMATFWKAEIYHQQKSYATSTKEFNNFLALYKSVNSLPDPHLVHLANYAQGYNHIKQGDYNTALPYFEKTVEGIRSNQNSLQDNLVKRNVFGDAVLRVGDCFFKRNKYRDATKYYDEAINNKYSGYDYAIFQKGIIYGLENNNNQKILALEQLIREQPRSVYADDALFELGFAYEETGSNAKAKDALVKLTSEYKDRSNLINQAYIKLGLIAYNAGDKQTALRYYKSVFENNPTKQEGEDALAAIEEIYVVDLGKSDEYFKFLESVPGYKVGGDAKDSLSFRVAQVQYDNGNYERAITGYTEYLTKYPKGGYVLNALYNRGESYLLTKQYSKAAKDYQSVVDRGQSAFYQKALEKAAVIAYNHDSDFELALQLYSKLEQVSNNENTRHEAILGALRSAHRANKPQSVLSYAEKVNTNPRSTAEHKSLASFLTGKIHFDRKEYDKALQPFNEAIKLADNEQSAEARYLIARIYFEKQELATAEDLSKRVLEESASYPIWVARALILLSDIYFKQNDFISTRAALEAVIENFDQDQQILGEAQKKLAAVEQKEKTGNKSKTKKPDEEIDFNEFNGGRN